MKQRTRTRIERASLLAIFLCLGVVSVKASESFNSGDLLEAGGWSVSVRGRTVKTEPIVKISGTDAIQVPTSGGSSTIFSASNSEVKMEQELKEILAAIDYRPREGLQYSLKFGSVSDFDLEYSSGSQTNKLQATKDGYVWGFGVAGRIAPGSIVSTAIRWDLNFTQRNVRLDKFTGGSIVSASDEAYRQDEYQGSVTFSRRWKMLEPYAGVKVLRVVSRLTDNNTKEKVSGNEDGVSPFVGLQWSVADREMVTIEGSFVEEKSLTAGLKVQF